MSPPLLPPPHKKARSPSSTSEVLDSPGSTLATLLESVRISHGERGVDFVMGKIKEAIQDGMNGAKRDPGKELRQAEEAVAMLLRGNSILKDGDKEDILEAAFRDGSSVVCNNCGGLIKRERWSNHVEFWCTVTPSNEDENDTFHDTRDNEEEDMDCT
mmetsp:Transcript_17100/g.35205  ORF Transcript_17100/g.35205 Transcript_17100/m.35205 type:complete len:158 (-) Transcript_17100:40-513(-)